MADLNTLFEIWHAYPDVRWQLNEPGLRSFRKDSVRILRELATSVTRSGAAYPVPAHLDRTRLAALITRYVTRVT